MPGHPPPPPTPRPSDLRGFQTLPQVLFLTDRRSKSFLSNNRTDSLLKLLLAADALRLLLRSSLHDKTCTATHTHTHTHAHTHTHRHARTRARTHTHTHNQGDCTSRPPSRPSVQPVLLPGAAAAPEPDRCCNVLDRCSIVSDFQPPLVVLRSPSPARRRRRRSYPALQASMYQCEKKQRCTGSRPILQMAALSMEVHGSLHGFFLMRCT